MRERVERKGLSAWDLAAVERFEAYLRLVSEKQATGLDRQEATRLAYAEVYGECVYCAAKPL